MDQAEPVTAYFETDPASHLVLDLQPDLPQGQASGTAFVALSDVDPPRGYVLNLNDAAGHPLLPEEVRFYAGDLPGLGATWVRLDKVPDDLSVAGIWETVLDLHPQLGSAGWVPAPGAPSGKAAQYAPQWQLVLVNLPMETGRRELGSGWVGLLRERESSRARPRRRRLLRVVAAGPAELHQRAPELVEMRQKRVVLVGAGGLGSAIALELGRTCPAELVFVDGDIVDAGTAVRFPSAFRFAGVPKAQALSRLVCEAQPYTLTTNSITALLGAVRLGDEAPDLDAVLVDALSRADLVIDATANRRAQQYLSDKARECGVAYLQAEATSGVWGGLVALFQPDRAMCWVCVQHHLTDGTLPALPHSGAPDVQPPGCTEPTYTGTGFDLATIASHAVRVAVSHLTGGHGYGTFEHSVFTVSLRTAEGRLVPATWTGHDLDRHPACRNGHQ